MPNRRRGGHFASRETAFCGIAGKSRIASISQPATRKMSQEKLGASRLVVKRWTQADRSVESTRPVCPASRLVNRTAKLRLYRSNGLTLRIANGEILLYWQEIERPTGVICFTGAVAPHLAAALPLREPGGRTRQKNARRTI
jgi:hypothetical protein